MSKLKYQSPMSKSIGHNVVYGQNHTTPPGPTPQGQCRGGSAPTGATVGCQVGNDVTAGNCAFGQFPTSSLCTNGSSVGYANQCGVGSGLS